MYWWMCVLSMRYLDFHFHLVRISKSKTSDIGSTFRYENGVLVYILVAALVYRLWGGYLYTFGVLI